MGGAMALRLRLLVVGLFAWVASTAVGCSALDPPHADANVTGPGSTALDPEKLTCKADADCGAGEACTDGICQMKRCGSPGLVSAPPLGKRGSFGADRELIAVADAIDGYEPTDAAFARPSKLRHTLPGKRLLDAAGGNLTGKRPESVAAIAEGSQKLHVLTGDAWSEISVGFQGVALAAGDVDGDGTEEVVVVSREADVAICKVDLGQCERRSVDRVLAKDVVIADVDGDGHLEPVILADATDGKSYLFVMNLDAKATNEQEVVSIPTGATLQRIAAANLDGQGAVEILALEDGGYLGYASDVIRIYGQTQNGARLSEIGQKSVGSAEATDVYAADLDGDDKPEIFVLEGNAVEVFLPASQADMTLSYRALIGAGATHLASADLDGDSPAGMLVGDPELVAGPVVPMSVMVYPPYSRTFSEGTSTIGLGNRETSSELAQSTVTLRAAVGIGFEAEFPLLVKAAVSVRVDGQISRTKGIQRSIVVGDRFTVAANPTVEGNDPAVVVLACACYHAYTYRIEDPKRRLGDASSDGKLMSIFVPIGGQTALWSAKRYNALARRLGTLPVIDVPYTVGDPASYPKTRSKLDGTPIPSEDLLYTTPRAYRVSDVAQVGWTLEVAQSETTTEASSIGVSVAGRIKVGAVSFEGEVGGSVGQSYSLTVGREATFWGMVPPIRNDVRTPEDEHALHGYSFSPVVYRDFYETKDGKQGGFYVVSYDVGP